MFIKVLLVEDNLGDVRLVYEGFAEAALAEFHMTHVRRLGDALEYLQREACDVLLLDLGLPDSHGLETVTLARAQAPRVPIVVLTGFEDESLAVEALKCGAQDYIAKAELDSKLLARSMRYAIARKGTEEALAREAVAQAVAEELRRSRQRIITTQERVRCNLAFRLEGEVRASLMALKDSVQGFLKRASPSSETERLLKEVVEGLDRITSKEIDAVIRGLYPSILIWGLVPAIQSLVDQMEPNLPVEVQYDDELVQRESVNSDLLPEPVRLAAYRIAEEALENVAKRAQASRVTLELQLLPQRWLRLLVRADGPGLDIENSESRLGMASMRDYAEASGGQCLVTTTPGVGIDVIATLPLAGRGQELP